MLFAGVVYEVYPRRGDGRPDVAFTSREVTLLVIQVAAACTAYLHLSSDEAVHDVAHLILERRPTAGMLWSSPLTCATREHSVQRVQRVGTERKEPDVLRLLH